MQNVLIQNYLSQDGISNHQNAILHKLSDYLEDNSLDITRLTENDIAAVMAKCNSSSEQVVRRYIRLIDQFFVWLIDQGISADVSLQSVNLYYNKYKEKSMVFKKEWYYGDYSSMMDAFDRFARDTELTNPEKYAAYITLAWFGVPREKAFSVGLSEIVSKPSSFEIINFMTFAHPQAVRVLNAYFHSPGYFMKDGRFKVRAEKSTYLERPNYIPRKLAELSREFHLPHLFAFEEVSLSGLYSRAYATLEGMMIPIEIYTYQYYTDLIISLLNVPDAPAKWDNTLAKWYFPFYEWCKLFRKVDD